MPRWLSLWSRRQRNCVFIENVLRLVELLRRHYSTIKWLMIQAYVVAFFSLHMTVCVHKSSTSYLMTRQFYDTSANSAGCCWLRVFASLICLLDGWHNKVGPSNKWPHKTGKVKITHLTGSFVPLPILHIATKMINLRTFHAQTFPFFSSFRSNSSFCRRMNLKSSIVHWILCSVEQLEGILMRLNINHFCSTSNFGRPKTTE